MSSSTVKRITRNIIRIHS